MHQHTDSATGRTRGTLPALGSRWRLKSYSLEEFCQWKGIIHTFTDRAPHESSGLIERKIGQLNESTRAALLDSDLPACLWPEVYMAGGHTQDIVPSSAGGEKEERA